jgi:hypothetical protein
MVLLVDAWVFDAVVFASPPDVRLFAITEETRAKSTRRMEIARGGVNV